MISNMIESPWQTLKLPDRTLDMWRPDQVNPTNGIVDVYRACDSGVHLRAVLLCARYRYFRLERLRHAGRSLSALSGDHRRAWLSTQSGAASLVRLLRWESGD